MKSKCQNSLIDGGKKNQMSQRMGAMHEWIFYMRLQTPPGDYFPCEGSEDTQCTKAIKKDLVRGTSDSLKDAQWHSFIVQSSW